jgi:alkylation response protein AidB-like acyl-CoA dehydrogenase
VRIKGVSHPLAEAHIAVELSRMATIASAAAASMHGVPAARPQHREFAASERRLKALDQAIQTHGGNGLSHEYGLSELWFVTRLMRTAPVSREMVLNFIARPRWLPFY